VKIDTSKLLTDSTKIASHQYDRSLRWFLRSLSWLRSRP